MASFDPFNPHRGNAARRAVGGRLARFAAVVAAFAAGLALTAFGPVGHRGHPDRGNGASSSQSADGNADRSSRADGGSDRRPDPPADDSKRDSGTGNGDASGAGGTTPTTPEDPGAGDGSAGPLAGDGVDQPADPQAAPDAATADTSQVGAATLDGTLRTIVAPDINAFWAREFSTVYGADYTPPAAVGGYDPAVDSLTCGTDPTDVAIPDNALYCPDDNFIAYDREFMAREAQEAGPMAPVFILAHEWGHLVQNELQVTNLTTTPEIETNADCLAGAYAADLSQRANLTRDDIDDAVDVLVAGVPENSEGAPDDHGGKLDRVGAFNDGFRGGVTACVAP
jgi:predicted metalloprotease